MSNPGLNDGAADEDMYASDAAAEAGPLNAEERGQGNKILVSNSKTASFFANLTKRFFRSHEEVELSALENAIAVAVDTVEMLRQSQVATLVRVTTSMADVQDSRTQRTLPKARITILIRRTEQYVQLLQALAEEARMQEEAARAHAALARDAEHEALVRAASAASAAFGDLAEGDDGDAEHEVLVRAASAAFGDVAEGEDEGAEHEALVRAASAALGDVAEGDDGGAKHEALVRAASAAFGDVAEGDDGDAEHEALVRAASAALCDVAEGDDGGAEYEIIAEHDAGANRPEPSA